MLAKLRLAGYVLFLILAAWFGYHFYVNYSAVSISSADVAAAEAKAEALNDNAPQGTNAEAPIVDSEDATNSPASTNAPVAETNDQVAVTNALESTNTPVTAKASSPQKKSATKAAHLNKAREVKKATTAEIRREMMKGLGGMVGALICLGILFAYDFSRFMAGRGVDMLLDDDGTSNKDPEYEQAEQVWAEGRPMEAIELMRAYLKKNPREQYVALRIAEIYEKDFKNYLAAALEYEEVLKKKLPAENWGWAAIHLCNLYTKLGRQNEYETLLRRIVKEYGQTSAARKARKRLGLPEEGGDLPDTATPVAMQDTEPENEAAAPQAPSNLPPGFRPKK